jgi:hypothetical protein
MADRADGCRAIVKEILPIKYASPFGMVIVPADGMTVARHHQYGVRLLARSVAGPMELPLAYMGDAGLVDFLLDLADQGLGIERVHGDVIAWVFLAEEV